MDELLQRLRRHLSYFPAAREAADSIEFLQKLNRTAIERTSVLEQVLGLGVQMRERQRRYFKVRTQASLVESIQIEKAFDDNVKRALERTLSVWAIES